MKRKLVAIVSAGVVLLNVTPAFAAELSSQGGGTLADCLAAMTPNCPKVMGMTFGAHVFVMATGGDCTQLMQ